MKTGYSLVVFLILFLFLINRIIFCEEKILENDKILKKIQGSIMKNWKIIVTTNEIIFERDQDVWELYENQINAPLDTEPEQDKIERIKKNGKKTKTKVRYFYVEKWSEEKIKDVKEKNSSIQNKISTLMDKYNIKHLYDSFGSSKGGEYFYKGTWEEKKRINEYKKEKQLLENQIIKLPDHNTGKYSLFILSGTGYNDMYSIVYPFEATKEAYEIMNIVRENCENIE